MTGEYVVAPPYVAACDLGPATILVNYRTGDVRSLIGPSADWWAELAATGDPAASNLLDEGLKCALVDQLRSVGLLVPAATRRPWPRPAVGTPPGPSWGTQEIAAGRSSLPHARLLRLLIAALAVLVVLTTRHVGLRRTSMARLISLINWAAARGTRPATHAQARLAVEAVRRAGFWAPSRVACLEESAATVLLLSLSRFRVTWCHGVAADPVRLHAWIETTSGDMVAEPASTSHYTALLTIPGGIRGDDHH